VVAFATECRMWAHATDDALLPLRVPEFKV